MKFLPSMIVLIGLVVEPCLAASSIDIWVNGKTEVVSIQGFEILYDNKGQYVLKILTDSFDYLVPVGSYSEASIMRSDIVGASYVKGELETFERFSKLTIKF